MEAIAMSAGARINSDRIRRGFGFMFVSVRLPEEIACYEVLRKDLKRNVDVHPSTVSDNSAILQEAVV